MDFDARDATIRYTDEGNGRAAVLLHGFASNATLNWQSTSWMTTLAQAGYRVIAPDLRGHGASTKFYEPGAYAPETMAGDVLELMDHLGVERAEIMGYSMGARIAVALAMKDPARVRHLILAGVGDTLLNPLDDPALIASHLRGEGPDAVPPVGSYRTFAQRYGGDLEALAACIQGVRTPFDRAGFADIQHPILVISGAKDTVSGAPGPLAALNPLADAVMVPDKDHMLMTGDPTFKKAVLAFIAEGA